MHLQLLMGVVFTLSLFISGNIKISSRVSPLKRKPFQGLNIIKFVIRPTCCELFECYY